MAGKLKKVTPLKLDAMALSIYGTTRSEALRQNICLNCKKPATWYSMAGATEYKISGLCETCFDKLFAE
jgi:hypothetical protein